MKTKRMLCLFLGLLLLAPITVFGGSFDTVVVFGDSLSDNGNLYAVDASKVPAATYYQGRFSNGPVWAEYLTDDDRLDCTLVDVAYGGAKTQGATPPGLVEQVTLYTAGPLPDDALFVIWIGANDFLDGGTDYATSVANIEDALEDLATFGAENILILNLPNLGATPRMLGTGNEANATTLTQAFNTALAAAVDDFQADYPNITVYELDIYTFLQSVIADPAAYGLTNVTEVSLNFAVSDNFDNSAGYLFWDEIHPTTEAHEAVAQQAYLLLPEDDDDTDDDDDDDDDDDLGCFITGIAALK